MKASVPAEAQALSWCTITSMHTHTHTHRHANMLTRVCGSNRGYLASGSAQFIQVARLQGSTPGHQATPLWAQLPSCWERQGWSRSR